MTVVINIDRDPLDLLNEWRDALTPHIRRHFSLSAESPALDTSATLTAGGSINEYMAATRYDINYPLTKDGRYTNDPDFSDARANNITVRQMQQDLVDAGYELPEYGVDGKFGDETEHALMQFQIENGLPPTGIADEQTLQMLSEVVLTNDPDRAESIQRQTFIPDSSLAGDASHLRELIAQGELVGLYEGGTNYDVSYNNGQINGELFRDSNGYTQDDFTQMTIAEVRQWQDEFVDAGSASSAVGKYQIIRKTLDGLVDGMDGIDENTVFSEDVQDAMADELLRQRGYDRFMNGELNEYELMGELAKEWASLPKNMGGKSYYAGDGLNSAHIEPGALLETLQYVRSQGMESTSPSTVTFTA